MHQLFGPCPPRPTAYPLVLSPPPPPPSSFISFVSLACPADRRWGLQMVEHQQQKGDPWGAQRPDCRELNMTWARQLFSTKLAWDERITQLHAVNTIKEVFGRPLWPLQLSWPNLSNFTVPSDKLKGTITFFHAYFFIKSQEILM